MSEMVFECLALFLIKKFIWYDNHKSDRQLELVVHKQLELNW